MQYVGDNYYSVTGSSFVGGGTSWTNILGSFQGDTITVTNAYMGLSGSIDLGTGSDSVKVVGNGLYRYNLTSVETITGSTVHHTWLQLLNIQGNTFTTDGSLRGIQASAGRDVVTVTGNRDTAGGTAHAGSGQNDNVIDLGGGNDRLVLVDNIVRSGTDHYDGGVGADELVLRNTTASFISFDFLNDNDLDRFETVVLSSTNAAPAGMEADFSGQTEALDITGDDVANVIIGGSGNDTITGGSADDTITGGDGADTIDGGTGTNTYRFNTGDVAAGETITFSSGLNDRFAVITSTDFRELNGGATALSGWSCLGSGGNLKAA